MRLLTMLYTTPNLRYKLPLILCGEVIQWSQIWAASQLLSSALNYLASKPFLHCEKKHSVAPWSDWIVTRANSALIRCEQAEISGYINGYFAF
jgi:hypothetical protein